MSRGGKCLINNNLINYTSGDTYSLETKKAFTLLRKEDAKIDQNICCFYDGYPLNCEGIGLPKKKTNDGFVLWGYFCSVECARAFIQENSGFCNRDKEKSLLALMAIQKYGLHFRVNNAPSKFLLEKYGGPLTIEQWRKENLSSRLWTVRNLNTERTNLTYECFLKTEDSSKIFGPGAAKSKQKQTTASAEFELERRKTPAHFPKKSLRSFVNS